MSGDSTLRNPLPDNATYVPELMEAELLGRVETIRTLIQRLAKRSVTFSVPWWPSEDVLRRGESSHGGTKARSLSVVEAGNDGFEELLAEAAGVGE